jgi:hypothetical protein
MSSVNTKAYQPYTGEISILALPENDEDAE